jgi:hypothetical protein
VRKLLALAFLSALPAFCALPYQMQWRVTATGSDSNNSGGFYPLGTSCGTDYSLQNSPQISYTDLVVGVTTTTYTSVLHAVTSAVTCNTLHVVSGTGCTTGTFYISAETGGTPNFATVDRSLGTAASVCTAYLGGAFTTIAQAMSVNSGALDTIWIKTATTTLTSSLGNCVSQGSCSNSTNAIRSITLSGYDTTPGDVTVACIAASTCTRPLITTSTGSVELFQLVGSIITASFTVQNLELSNTASSSAFPVIAGINGGPNLYIYNTKIDVTGTNSGGASGIYNDNEFSFITIYACDFNVATGNSGVADQEESQSNNGHGIWSYYSYYHGAGTAFYDVDNGGLQLWHWIGNVCSGMSRCLYAAETGDNSVSLIELVGNAFYNPTNEAVRYNSFALGFLSNINNIYYGGTYGLYINGYIADGSSVPFGIPFSQSNAYGGQSTAPYLPYTFGGNRSGVLTGTPPGYGSSDISLGACNPFNNPGSGDFSLSTCGKAALAQAGYPGVSLFGTGYAAIGALPAQGGGTSGGGASAYVQ